MADDLVGEMLLTVADEAKLRGKAEGLALGKTEGIALGEARGKVEGIALGEARGKAEGIAQGKTEGIAQVLNLLKSGKPPEEILQLYGGAALYGTA